MFNNIDFSLPPKLFLALPPYIENPAAVHGWRPAFSSEIYYHLIHCPVLQ